MSKVKYYYDSDTLSYRKVERKKARTIWNVFLYLSSSALWGLVIVLIIFSFGIDTPKERSLERELSQMKLQYEFQQKRMVLIEDVLGDIQERDNNIYRVLFDANPIPDEIRQAGFGGINRYLSLIHI